MLKRTLGCAVVFGGLMAGAPVQVDCNVLDSDLALLLRLSAVIPDRTQRSIAARREQPGRPGAAMPQGRPFACRDGA